MYVGTHCQTSSLARRAYGKDRPESISPGSGFVVDWRSIQRCDITGPSCSDFVAELHEASARCRETTAEIDHPDACRSAMRVGRLRAHLLPQPGERASQLGFVGGG